MHNRNKLSLASSNRMKTPSIQTSKLLTEFKAFAMKGNVVDLAVAVVIGGAFGKIVNSVVADLIMPCVSLLTGGMDISKANLVLRAATEGHPALTLSYGTFIQSVIDFIIIALAIFIFLKILLAARIKQAEAPAVAPAPAPPAKTPELEVLEEIRDLLKK